MREASMIDSTPLMLRAEDQPAPDLQSLGIDLAELLQGAAEGVVQAMYALEHGDIIRGRQRATRALSEAHEYLCAAIEARETLAKEQRAAGLMAAPWGVR